MLHELFITHCTKGLVVLKFKRHEHRDDTSIVDGDQKGVKC